MSTYALDRIGPSEMLSAVSLVKQGRVFDLGSELSKDMPQGPRDTFQPFSLSQYHLPKALNDKEHKGFDFSMDVISGSPHLGTHLDALIHVQQSGKIYGGGQISDALGPFGWEKYGVETVPPIIGRGILLDMPAYYGVEKLKDGFEITREDLQGALKKQNTEVRKGDVVLFRTGKFAEFLNRDEAYFNAQPGVGPEGALWLYRQGMAVLGSDTTSTEPSPFPDPMNTTHAAMLVDSGVHILEILDLEELAREKVYEFLFVALPLKVVGGTGSWLRPAALI